MEDILYKKLMDALALTLKGRKNAESVRYAMHAEHNIRQLEDKIRSRALKPFAEAFINISPCQREIFNLSMDYGVIQHLYDLEMRGIMESLMSDRTYNNRVGKGAKAAINRLSDDIREVTKDYTEKAWIIGQDIRGCFPNTDLNITYGIQRNIIEKYYCGPIKDDLLYILQAVNYSYPAKHCTRITDPSEWENIPDYKSLFKQPDNKGGIIGSLYWQFAVGFNFNKFDHAQELLGENIRYVRFVDDMRWVIPAQDKDMFLRTVIPWQREMLRSLGMELHPKKFYCQPCSHGTNFIGRTVKMSRIYPSRRIVRRSHARIAEMNSIAFPKYIESFISSINSYIGILKGCNGYNRVMELLNMLSPQWRKYVYFDNAKMCVKAKEGYRHYELIGRKLKIDINHSKKWNKKINYQRSSQGNLNCNRSCTTVPQRLCAASC